MENSSKKKLLILSGDFMEDYELMIPYQALLMVGFDVSVICPGKKKGDKIKTAVHQSEGDQTYSESPGHNFTLNCDFEGLNLEEHTGVVIPGGRAPEYLRQNKDVLDIVRHFITENKPIASVCHGLQVLLAAGIKGRTITCHRTVIPEVSSFGAIYKQPEDLTDAVVDGNIVTAINWRAQIKWLAAFLKVLGVEITSS